MAPGLPLKIEIAALLITTHVALESLLHPSVPRVTCAWNGRKTSICKVERASVKAGPGYCEVLSKCYNDNDNYKKKKKKKEKIGTNQITFFFLISELYPRPMKSKFLILCLSTIP